LERLSDGALMGWLSGSAGGSDSASEIERGVRCVIKRARDDAIIVEGQAKTVSDLRRLLRDISEAIAEVCGGEEEQPGPAGPRRR
jgi:hypothetical protein